MAPDEMKALSRELAPVIVRFVGDAIAPVLARVTALEARPVGKDGVGIVGAMKKDGGILLLTLSNGGILDTGIHDGEDGQPGRDGKDGKDAEGLEALVKAQVDAAVLPRPAEAGGPGPDLPEIVRLIDEAVRKAVGALEIRAGLDGAPGRDGRDGVAGQPGRDGEDGQPGVDGKDGLGFDELAAEFDGERTLTLRFQRGAQVRQFAMRLPIVLDRGVWHPGDYLKGDGVTHQGSFFIAQRDTPDKPETSDAWRLAVKRGRDGKDGKLMAEKAAPVVRVGRPNGKDPE
jgi:hypothetical protein